MSKLVVFARNELGPELLPSFGPKVQNVYCIAPRPCGCSISMTSHTIFSAVSKSSDGPKVRYMAGNTECGLPARLDLATEAT